MKMNIYINRYLKGAFLACAVLLSACNKEDVVSSNQHKGNSTNKVTFGITSSTRWTEDVIGGAAGSAQTKASSSTEMVPMDIEGGDLGTQIYMYMVEEDVPTVTDTMSVATKSGSASEPDWTNIGIYSFQVPAAADKDTYDPQEASVFMDNICLKTDGSYSGGDKYWPGSSSMLQFFAYQPYHNHKDSDGNLAVSGAADVQVPGLTITNTGNLPKFTYVVPTTIADQNDLKDGASELINGAVTDQVQISLYHLMSQIEVKAGTLDEGFIKSISFKNIYNKGDRFIGTPVANGWEIDTDNKVNYVQNLNLDINASRDALNTNPVLGDTMYLMPQTLHDDAQIEIVIEVTSINPHSTDPNNPNRTQEYTLTKQLKAFVSTWAPNKKYSYIISTPEEVEVLITDSVNGNVKSNLTIMNTGLSDVYIRATFVGSWVIPNETETYVDDVIVADWDPTESGYFNWGADNANSEPTSNARTGWHKHSDGFYYHLNPVSRGQETAKLFEKYTLTSSPIAGAVLDFTIIVQAVQATDVQFAWPDAITQYFSQAAFIRQ